MILREKEEVFVLPYRGNFRAYIVTKAFSQVRAP